MAAAEMGSLLESGVLAEVARGCDARQGSPAITEWLHQPVCDETVECALPLPDIGPGGFQCITSHPVRGLAYHRKQPATTLSIGALVRRPAPARSLRRRIAGGAPAAHGGERTCLAGRSECRAHECAELHDRHRPLSRCLRVSRKQLRGGGTLGHGQPARRGGTTVDHPRKHAADVRVEHGVPLPVSERRDRGGGVLADARQGSQLVEPERHLATMPIGDHRGAGVQPQRPAWIAQSAPRMDRLARRRSGQRRRGRPASHPGVVGGQHPGHRGLLQHELRDDHLPRGRTDGPPWQSAGVVPVPLQNTHLRACHARDCADSLPVSLPVGAAGGL